MFLQQYKNWITNNIGSRKIMGLRFTSTWRCNSKCITCSIWKNKSSGENDLSLREIDAFSKSKYFSNTEYITFSGGEPTLRKDLPEIIEVLHNNIPSARFSLTTHGMNPAVQERIFTYILKRNPSIRFGLVGISLNGPKDIHDFTRGIKGSFEKAIDTYKRISPLVHCEFSFTFCKENIEYFEWVQNFAKSLGTRAYICWTVMNERFEVSDKDLVFENEGMDKVLNDYIERSLEKPTNNLFKLSSILTLPPYVTFSCLYDHIINRKIMPCYAGRSIVHIDPEGNVYPCNFKLDSDRLLGNIRENSFDNIWERIPHSILKDIRAGNCMYPNGLCGDSDIYPSLRNSPPFVLQWYLKKIVKKEPLISFYDNE